MKKKSIGLMLLFVLSTLLFFSCNDDTVTPIGANIISSKIVERNQTDNVTVSVFASGLNSPRGLKFGPDGYLYVAEAGLGGDISTVGQCEQVIPPVGPYAGGYSARILKISTSGIISTVVDNLPSSQNSLGDRVGVADIEFLDQSLYALLAGGGCSHGHSDYPASLIKINTDGSWSVIADLSNYQQNNPVAFPEEDDFEPDGSWYSLIKAKGNLYADERGYRIIPASRGQFQTWDKPMEQEEFKNPNKELGDGSSSDSTSALIRNFLDCVKSRKLPFCSLEEGHRSTSFSHLANIALKVKQRLDWDAVNERFTNSEKANELLSYEYRKPWEL